MDEDVRKSVEELEALYYKGNKTVDIFIELYEKLLDGRFDRDFVRLSLPLPYMTEDEAQEALDEYEAFEVLGKKVNEFYAEWTSAVNSILKNTPRFRLQFNDPNEMGYMGNPMKNIPPDVQVIEDKISELYRRTLALYKIVIEMDRSSEQIKQPNASDVEPATYDKKKRTIFFADEAIRFKADAPFTPALCDVIFSKPNKFWTLKELQTVWDDLYEYLGNERPTDWHRVYEAVRRVNERVRKATGVEDLFAFSTKAVRLNKKYIEVTKKSQ